MYMGSVSPELASWTICRLKVKYRLKLPNLAIVKFEVIYLTGWTKKFQHDASE